VPSYLVVCLACSSIYFRAHCLFESQDGGPILLIVPSTLLTQWQTEISKHIRNYRIVGSHAPQKNKGKKRAALASNYIPLADADETVSLNVLVYDNFERHSPHLDARNLVKYDVILMSFQSLRAGYHESKMDYSSSRAR
jgi:SNF2 family DNA or RNA helicase